MIEDSGTKKTSISCLQDYGTASDFFAASAAAENVFSSPCKKTKTPPAARRSPRITPLLAGTLAAIAGLSGMFFTAPALPAEEFKQAEQILCPENIADETLSLLDEYYLARAYDKGYCGVTADKETALQWYREAATHGHTLAQYHLAEIYFTGNGGTPDYPEAKKWYQAAAEQGHGLSQLRLAFLYAESHFKGLTTDYAEAEKWFLKAAEQDAGDARFRLGNFYHNYKNPPEPEKAVAWLTRAAEGGHRVAMFDLARMLKKGEGTLKNPAQSLIWMKKAATLGLVSAQMTLSEMYATGNGAPKDPVESMTWTLKVATAPAAAVFWINKVADIFFDGGESIPKNYAQALRFYERAALKDDPHALMRIGQMYLQGLGVKKDPVKAQEYLERAADRGNAEAKSLLKRKE